MKRLLCFLALAACGGGAKTVETTTTTQAAAAGKTPIDAFHDVLAPLWHSPESPERTEKTCAAVPAMESGAQNVGDASLVESVKALGAECAGDRAAFQTRFAAVHDSFHAAMEKAGVGHEEHH